MGFDWLPILLWIAVPVVSWAIVGNLLETTVALFTTGALVAAAEGVRVATASRGPVGGGDGLERRSPACASSPPA